MRTRIMLVSAAALVALAGCSEADDPDPAPAATSLPAATSPPAGTTPTETATAAPTTTTPTATTPTSPAASASPGALSLRAACDAIVADQREALGTLRDYVQNPLNGSVTVRELDRIRTELLVDERSAPPELRELLNQQVGVLNSAIQGIQDGNLRRVDVSQFQSTGQQVLDYCGDQAR